MSLFLKLGLVCMSVLQFLVPWLPSVLVLSLLALRCASVCTRSFLATWHSCMSILCSRAVPRTHRIFSFLALWLVTVRVLFVLYCESFLSTTSLFCTTNHFCGRSLFLMNHFIGKSPIATGCSVSAFGCSYCVNFALRIVVPL